MLFFKLTYVFVVNFDMAYFFVNLFMFPPPTTSGAPVSAETPVVVDQPHSSSCFSPIRCVRNSTECLCTSFDTVVAQASVMSAAGGEFGGTIGDELGGAIGSAIGCAIGSFFSASIGVAFGVAFELGLAVPARSFSDDADTTNAPTEPSDPEGIDNTEFQDVNLND